MNAPINKVNSIENLFHEELKGIYPDQEIENFIYLIFEEYLGFSKTDLVLNANNSIDKTIVKEFVNTVKLLEKHHPIQYILGVCEFYGLKFKVNRSVMIPRPETEELVDWVLKETQNTNIKILDIGAGSGCIAITLKKNLPKTSVTAIDVSKAALIVARENAEINNVSIDFIHDDILNHTNNRLQKLIEYGKFDIIISNPPYVRMSEKDQMEKNVLDHEPHSALFVDDSEYSGLLFYEAISNFAKTNGLKSGGKLYLEINEKFGAEVVQLIQKKGFTDIVLRKDINNKERMVRCVLNDRR